MHRTKTQRPKTRGRLRRRGGGVLAVLVTIAAPVLAAAIAYAGPAGATGSYAALGDSYSSGVGTRSYLADGTTCQRSRYAYPQLVAGRLHVGLAFGACSGATTRDLVNRQLGFVGAPTRWVTMTVGGNDAGFSSVLTECAQPSWVSDCLGAVTAARTIITHALPGRLDAVLARIRARAPRARIVLVGYPLLFNGTDCNAATFFSPADEAHLNDATKLLDNTLRARALTHGATFVEARTYFGGHAICAHTEWINGLSNPVHESYHPNRAGQGAYADLVDGRL